MKQLLFLSALFSLICFINTAFAQELRVVSLDKDNSLFASSSRIVLKPGDKLQFKAVDGDFAIYIVDAVRYLKIGEADLKIRINSATNPLSDLYDVMGDNEMIELTYAIYCISTYNWPDAPPKIIIQSNSSDEQ
jgi:hypothetical protein